MKNKVEEVILNEVDLTKAISIQQVAHLHDGAKLVNGKLPKKFNENIVIFYRVVSHPNDYMSNSVAGDICDELTMSSRSFLDFKKKSTSVLKGI